ncbi:DNA polymerase III subunit gamma/tau [Tepidimicrobium xylanilyticum]|uniref:DNA-directed DNA polymerase n=1 Tax=Tepidimicrobium xylanilyticum TaxID=1123352 RepID=A0A1H3C8L4_9FIRM|nr:DNA polymerase III subunit gamma/tau [Tepidimicrobium xylanilyticum]GMG97985.1 DNA polymerase III subunit gamma/tau [Tepidimicrobium xylanilyticum]SDX50400.1 DNA polymerase-3 subunit gamma/tau [Tepidimicrobium xylanilyticum]
MYQALYRQYRPRTFDEVLGQKHITTTLKNQIKKQNIGHAYLFSGTKGTGKTSTAKIFSRAINCLNPIEGNPCNKCEICKGILDESIMDIIEMDAASNNSVDDIRELRDKVVYPPSRTKYKVYIIDEVHMLSKGAFNALLKTLEEPPKHLIFILATTEKERLPQTILSRCQRFDFRRITTKDIVANMKNICNQLNIFVEERALKLIARNSDGAMRDALSLLDQCISYKGEKLTYQDALDVLGIANTDLLFSIVEDVKDNNLHSLLFKIDDLIQQGKDVNQFIKDLILHFRNLLIVKTSKNAIDLLDLDEEVIDQFIQQSQDISLDFILKSLDILNKSENQAKWVTQPRIILEMAMIKLVNLEDEMNLEERIKRLEEIINTGQIEISKPVAAKTVEKPKKKLEQSQMEEETIEIEPIQPLDSKEELSLETIKKEWKKVLTFVKEKNIRTHAFLIEGKVKSYKDGNLFIAYKDGYGIHKEAMERPNNKELVEKITSSYFNKDIRINFIMEDSFEEEIEEENKFQGVIDFFGEDIVEIE